MKTVQLKSSTLLIASALALTFASTTLFARGGMEGGMMPPPNGTSTSTSTATGRGGMAPPPNGTSTSTSTATGRGGMAPPPRGSMTGTGTSTGTSTSTRTERGGAGAQAGGREGGRPAPLTLKSIDSNGDNLITAAEFTTAKQSQIQSRFTAMDRDGNGSLSATEFQSGAAQPPMGGMEEGAALDQTALELCLKTKLGSSATTRPTWSDLLASGDTNADSALSQSELLADAQNRATTHFTALDSNSSGSLESSELQAAATQVQAQREARKSCADEQLNVIELLNQ